MRAVRGCGGLDDGDHDVSVIALGTVVGRSGKDTRNRGKRMEMMLSHGTRAVGQKRVWV